MYEQLMVVITKVIENEHSGKLRQLYGTKSFTDSPCGIMDVRGDSMAKAIGIGGVFLQFKGEEQDVMDWYEKYLGLDMTTYGTGFTDGTQYTLLSFSRSKQPSTPYLNLRVDDIDELMDTLKEQKIEVLQEIKEYDYGKFARFKDPFGNAIELWEAYEDKYVKMVQKEIKDYQKAKTLDLDKK